MTVTAPKAPAGVIAVSSLAVTNATAVAGVDPNNTVAPFTKALPVMVTEVPPAGGPAPGTTAATLGDSAVVTLVTLVVSPSGLQPRRASTVSRVRMRVCG